MPRKVRTSKVKRSEITSYVMRLAKYPCPGCGSLWMYVRTLIPKGKSKKIRLDYVCLPSNHVLTGKYKEFAQDLDAA